MAKVEPQLDVLVLGEHPSTYLAAAILVQGGKIRVVHACIPGQSESDRLVIINPEFFSLHPILEPLRRKLEMVNIYGLQFLSADPSTRSEFRSQSPHAYAASPKTIWSPR